MMVGLDGSPPVLLSLFVVDDATASSLLLVMMMVAESISKGYNNTLERAEKASILVLSCLCNRSLTNRQLGSRSSKDDRAT